MKKPAIFSAAFALVLSVGLGAAQAFSLLEFDAAVSALQQFDPELDPPPNNPNKDFVVGGFRASAFPEFSNGYSVRSGPNGGDPAGMASSTSHDPPAKLRLDAVCLAVYENLAVVGMVGTFEVSGETFDYVEIDVLRDGGPGGTLDGFNAFLGDPNDCHNPTWIPLALAAPGLENGNILINDAP